MWRVRQCRHRCVNEKKQGESASVTLNRCSKIRCPYAHTETPRIVPKQCDNHLNDTQQKPKPQPRVGQEIEFGLSALLKQLAELAAILHHLVDDAVLNVENLVGVLLQPHGEPFEELEVELVQYALRDAVQAPKEHGRKARQPLRHHLPDHLLRQLGHFGGEQSGHLFGIESGKGFLDGQQLRRDHFHQRDRHGSRLARDNPLPAQQTEWDLGFSPEWYTAKTDGIKDHLHGEPVGEPADNGGDAGNEQVGPRTGQKLLEGGLQGRRRGIIWLFLIVIIVGGRQQKAMAGGGSPLEGIRRLGSVQCGETVPWRSDRGEGEGRSTRLKTVRGAKDQESEKNQLETYYSFLPHSSIRD